MEAGVSEYVSPVAGEKPEYPDSDPRDFIELNTEMFKPSTTYATLDISLQKDMSLSNLTFQQTQYIALCYETIDACIDTIRRNPEKYKSVNEYVNKVLLRVIRIVAVSRGLDGFTAKLMRKQIQEQRQTISYGTGREKQKGGAGEGAKRFMGF